MTSETITRLHVRSYLNACTCMAVHNRDGCAAALALLVFRSWELFMLRDALTARLSMPA